MIITPQGSFERIDRAQAIFAERWPALRWGDYASRDLRVDAFREADRQLSPDSEVTKWRSE